MLSATLELILSYDPDIILYRYSAGVDMPLEQVEALQDLKAIKSGNVHGSTTIPTTSNTAGLFISEHLRAVAGYLYPDVDFSK